MRGVLVDGSGDEVGVRNRRGSTHYLPVSCVALCVRAGNEVSFLMDARNKDADVHGAVRMSLKDRSQPCSSNVPLTARGFVALLAQDAFVWPPRLLRFACLFPRHGKSWERFRSSDGGVFRVVARLRASERGREGEAAYFPFFGRFPA